MKEIKSIQEAEEYINTFNFYDIFNENKVALLSQFKTCEQFALDNNNDKILCRTRTFMLYLLTEENKLQQAATLAYVNLKYAKEKKLDDELLYMIAIVAHLYQLIGNLSASEEIIQIALESINITTDNGKISKLYSIVAEQYFFTKNQDKCIEFYEQALQYALKTKNNTTIALVCINYSDHLLDFNLNEKALQIIELGKKYATIIKNELITSLINDKFGLYYTKKNDLKNAIRYFLKIMKYTVSTNNILKEMGVSIDLAKAYFLNKQYSKVFKLLQRVEKLSTESNNNSILILCYSLYVEYYEKKQKFELALQYLKKFNAINELIYNEKSNDKIRNLQITYEVKTIKQEREYAENMARIKHDFLANMSHEIRTPINSILGICYLLQQDNLSEKQQQYVKRLNYSGENLLGIINDVLDISKIEAGKFNLSIEPFSINELIKNIHQLMLLKAEEKQIQFNVSIDNNSSIFVKGDAIRINQILLNLISNAIKFTKEGNINLFVNAIEKQQHKQIIQFKLTDSGIGMSAKQLSKIFNEYEQATDTIQQKFGGTGLGLSITKKLVELMNGSIEVESALNIGTTFKVNIPFDLMDNKEIKNEIENINTVNLSNRKIYIADDNDENRIVISEILWSLNSTIQIQFAKNGFEVIELINQQIPDIVLMDLDMPELNGFDATQKIQQKFAHKNIKIIACTASLLSLTKEELIELGFADLLQKPFTIKQLIQVLN